MSERCKWCGAGVYQRASEWIQFDCLTLVRNESKSVRRTDDCKDRQIAALEKEVNTLLAGKQDAERKIFNLAESCDALRDRIAALEKERDEARAKLSRVEKQFQSYRDCIDGAMT